MKRSTKKLIVIDTKFERVHIFTLDKKVPVNRKLVERLLGISDTYSISFFVADKLDFFSHRGITTNGYRRFVLCHHSYWENNETIELMVSDGSGVARLSKDKDNKYWFLSDLNVDIDKRNQGIATMLVDFAITWVDKIMPIYYILGDEPWVRNWLNSKNLKELKFENNEGI